MGVGAWVHHRSARIALVMTIVAGLVASVAMPAEATAAAVSLSASTASLSPGSTIDLTAGMPVAAAGTTSQEIVQEIDPTKVRLTQASDVIAPAGWTVSYCSGASTDCTNAANFTTTVPSPASAWANVKAVKATGTLISDGTDAGRQVAVGAASGSAVNTTPATINSSGTGDGLQAFFDPARTRVFNIWHHGGASTGQAALQRIDCHVITTGATCAGFPFDPGAETNYVALGRVVGNRLWMPSAKDGEGFACVDLTNVFASGGAPSLCATPFVRLRSSTGLTGMSKFVYITGVDTSGTTTETKLWGLGKNGNLLCLDTAMAAPCLGQPANGWTLGFASSLEFQASITDWDGRVYVTASTITGSPGGNLTTCVLKVDPSTRCPGFDAADGSNRFQMAGARTAAQLLRIPDASGRVVAVCSGTSGAGYVNNGKRCVGANGELVTTSLPIDTMTQYDPTVTRGSRVYWYGGAGPACWDASLASGAGASCMTAGSSAANLGAYAVTPDPLVADCIWAVRDPQPVIQTGNVKNSTPGCSSVASTRVRFSGAPVVPRMGCSVSTSVQTWKSFVLETPTTGFTSATLTVVSASGVIVPGWSGVSITAGIPVDLSSLSVAASGQAPSFVVDLAGATGALSASAKVRAVGDSPQLCLTVTAPLVCPTGIGPVSSIPGGSTTMSATGTSTDGSTTTTLTPASTNVSISAPSTTQCGGELKGRAGTLTLGTTGDAVVGLTVTLLDSSGNVVTSNGSPVTTTTDASGNYSFGYLYPADYKVRFAESGTTSAPAAAVISSVTVATGGTGTVLASGSCATSWTFDSATSTCVRTVTSTLADVGAPTGSTLSYLVVGGGGGGAAYNAAGSRGGDGGAVVSGSVTTTGVVGVTIGAGGAAGAAGAASALTGGAVVSAAGGAAGGASNPAGTGTASSLSGTSVTYGVDGVNWSGAAYATAGGAGTANRGNGGGAGWRSYEGAGCYEPGAQHVYVNPGGPCGTGGTYENGGWSTINAAGAGGSGVVVLRYPLKMASNAATVPVGGVAVVNALYAASAVARANTSTGAQDAVQTIAVLADDTASTGATYSGGSTALKLCTAGQTSPNCTGTSLVISGQGSYAVSGTNITFTPCTGVNTPVMSPACTGRFTGAATAATYQSTDSLGRIASSTVTPRVVSLPTANADAQSGAWDTNQTYTPLANDTAGTGATLAVSPAGICLNTVTVASSCTSTTLTISNQGTYTLNANGTVTFDPLPSFNGPATAIKYAAADSLGQKVLATITPTVSAPPPPTANPDATFGIIGAAQTVNPFTNDTAVSGITFTATSVKLCSTGQTPPSCTATSMVVSGKGSYSVNASTGVITFTPCSGVNTPVMSPACTAGFVGAAPAVTYQVTTSQSQVASSTYTATVVPPPTATADAQTAGWDVTQSFTPTTNDTAGTGASIVAVPYGICINTVTVASSCTTVGNSITISGEGTYTLNPSTGVVTFDPLPSFRGVATTIEYAVVDSLGQKVLSTIRPTVSDPPAPTANAETRTVVPGGSVAFTTLTGTGGLAITGGPTFNTSATCLVNTGVTPNTCVTSLTVSGEGVYTVDTATGVVTFVADSSVTAGTKTPVTYRVTDATGLTATSTLTPVVPPPPTLNPDHSVDEQNVTQVLSVLSNDSADISTSLVPSSVRLCADGATAPYDSTNCNLTTLDVADVGRFTAHSDGTISFDPCTLVTGMTCAGNYFGSTVYTGTTAPVRYVVSDLVGQRGSSTLTVEVLPPPVVQPQNDVGSAPFATPVVFDPLGNDSGGDTVGLTAYTTVGTTAVDPATLALCGATETPPACTQTSIDTPAGNYSLDAATHEVTFTPATNFVGTPSSSPLYVVCNQLGGTWAPATPPSTCKTARLTPTIGAPVVAAAVDDSQTGPYNTPIAFSVLVNDTIDPELIVAPSSVKLCGSGQTVPTCSALTVDSQGEGTYTVDGSTGVVTFTPLASFSGTPAITPTYQFTDSFGQTASAVIVPDVAPPTAPAARPESKMVLPGNSIAFTNVVGASALASGTSLRVGISGGPCLVDPSDSVCKTSFTIAGEGDWIIDQSTGIATFTADSLASTGAKTAITYRVLDAVGQPAEAQLTPMVPPPATLVDDTGSDSVDQDQTFAVLTNDVAGTGTTLVASSLLLCGSTEHAPHCTATSVTINGEGTYTIDPTSHVVVFDPEPTFVGTVTPVEYQVTDSMGRVSSASIAPEVTADPPVAEPDTSTGDYNTIQTKDLLANDTTDAATMLDAATLRLCDPTTTPAETPINCTVVAGSTIEVPSVGTYIVDVHGVITFTPLASFTGAAPALNYQVRDTLGQYASSSYTPTVTPPAAPTAVADTSTGIQGAAQSRDVLANDSTSASGQTIVDGSIRLCGATQHVPGCSETTVVIDGQGVYSLVPATGEVTFSPCSAAGTPPGAACTGPFTGVADAVTYQFSTNTAQVASSTYTPTVVPPPAAAPDGAQGAKGRPQTITLLSNDAPGASAAPLDPSTLRLCGRNEVAPACQQTVVDVAGVGRYEITASGTVTFTPDPNFEGAAPAVPYVVADILGQRVSSTLEVIVVPPPAPITADDLARGPNDTALTIDPIANDSAGEIPAGQSGTVHLVRSSLRLCAPGELAPHCTATSLTTADGLYEVDTNTGFVTFTPRSGFVGQVTQPVTYQVTNDWTGLTGPGTSTAVITIVIDPAAPPVVPPTIPASEIAGGSGATAGSGGAGLPVTGRATGAYVLWGFVLTALGAALAVLGRRAASNR